MPVSSLQQEFDDLLSDYVQAIESVKNEIDSEEYESVKGIIERFRTGKILISAFGETNSGKSALLNSLMGFDNKDPDLCPFKHNENINFWSEEIEKNNKHSWTTTNGYEIILQDTPGIAGDITEHFETAKKYAEKSDIILYVMWLTPRGAQQISAISNLLSLKKNIVFVINKVDIQSEPEIIATKNRIQEHFPDISDDFFIRTAGNPMRDTDSVQIQSLVNRIISIVTLEKENLIKQTLQQHVAAAFRIAAARIEQQVERERIEEQKKLTELQKQQQVNEEKANDIINRYSQYAALSAGVLPIFADAASAIYIASKMFKHVREAYGINKEELDSSKIFEKLYGAFWGVLGSSGLSLAIYLAISSIDDFIPLLYFAGMTLDYVMTYFLVQAVGKTFSFYCKNNQSWAHHQTIQNAMAAFIKKNINEMVLDKLPRRFKKEFLKYLNLDKLKNI